MNNVHVIAGDITKARADAIVNAANPQMLGGGGVDGAIHRAAGPALRAACESVPEVAPGVRCPFGEARITPAGQLSARYVIHTVGPIYAKAQEPHKVLASAYTHSLELALEHQCHTIAFPAISCGVYGYPYQPAAEIALQVCHQPVYQSLNIYFYLINPELTRVWQQVNQRYQ